MYLALMAAEANPAAAVQVAWAGPAVAKKAIDFFRHVFPGLDTTDKMKEETLRRDRRTTVHNLGMFVRILTAIQERL